MFHIEWSSFLSKVCFTVSLTPGGSQGLHDYTKWRGKSFFVLNCDMVSTIGDDTPISWLAYNEEVNSSSLDIDY